MLGLGVWDTPTPIVHNVNIFLGSNEGSGWRSLKCRTALLSEITGITFFCDLNSRVVGFHMHTPSAPSAQPTHERLMSQAPGDLSSALFRAVLGAMPMEAKPLSWTYVPLPRRDPLAIFGHGVDDRAESGVKSVRSHDQRSCAGILLEYENNGSQVALGEVRLHVDHYVTYLRPQFIGVEKTDTSDGSDMDVLEADDTGKSVFFAQEPDMLNEDVDVKWFYMKGVTVLVRAWGAWAIVF
ncbi:hypothetical protein VTJ04DRAFT_5421 [Mycothermus thermophilus]|uniref:uncharacterized protein n=1 Tax=Humicola insolens TaxID=85995 RepID=UPI00374394BC